MKKIILVSGILLLILNFSYCEDKYVVASDCQCKGFDCCLGRLSEIKVPIPTNYEYKFPFGGKDFLIQEFGEKNICEKIKGENYFEDSCISKQAFEELQNQNLNNSDKKQIIFENKIDLDLDNFDLFKVWIYLFGLKFFFIILLFCSLIFGVVKFFKFKKSKKL